MASSLERLILGLSGQPVAKGQQITPEQRMQSAAGLLAAGRSLMDAAESGQSRGSAVLGAIQDAGGGAADARAQQITTAINQTKLFEASRKQETMQRMNEIRKEHPPFSSFDNPKAYYRSLGQQFFNAGAFQQGLELLKIGAPSTLEDMRDSILSEKNKQTAFYTPVYKAVNQLARLRNLLDGENGAASYSAMISFIKNLDDSVVREGEVATFGRFQGVLRNMETLLTQAKGSGFSEDVKDNMYEAAVMATKAMVEGYERHTAAQTPVYTALGMPAAMIFPKLDYDPTLFGNRRNNQKPASDNDVLDSLYGANGAD